MKNVLKRMTSAALALVMAIGIGATAASAAAPYADGAYTAKVAFLHETDEKPSMCNVLFDHDADIKVTGENAAISVYAAYPVPAFPTMGTDGTLKYMSITIDGTEYKAVSDIATKPLREFDETGSGFKVTAGEKYETQVLTFTIPTAKLDSLATAVKAAAFVNPVMNTEVAMRFQLTDITGSAAPEVKPSETSTKGMNITAEIAAPAPSYTVTIPESVSMGSLSTEKDNVFGYKVDVDAKNLGNGSVEVSAPSEGILNNGDHQLAFANSFGTQKASETAALNGEFSIAAKDVAAAAAGNYTGTATFTIRYFAG